MNLLQIPIHEIYAKMSTKGKVNHFTFPQVLEMLGDGNCAYTRQEFKDLNDVSFERINPCKDYVPGNVVMVKRSINSDKGATLDRFIKCMPSIPDDIKIKLLRKAIYQLEKKLTKSS